MSGTSIYTIPPPQTPLVENDGRTINRSWWRFFSSMFITTGSGTSETNLTTLNAAINELAATDGQFLQPRGTDYSAVTNTQLAQIAFLEARVNSLAATVQELQNTVAQNQLQAMNNMQYR